MKWVMTPPPSSRPCAVRGKPAANDQSLHNHNTLRVGPHKTLILFAPKWSSVRGDALRVSSLKS